MRLLGCGLMSLDQYVHECGLLIDAKRVPHRSQRSVVALERLEQRGPDARFLQKEQIKNEKNDTRECLVERTFPSLMIRRTRLACSEWSG